MKNLNFVLMALVVLSLPSTNAHSQGAPVSLQVLSYNIWGLPRPVSRKAWRFKEIPKRLGKYDVVAIQEAWSIKTKQVYKRAAKTHPYRAFGGQTRSIIGGSGIMMMSKYPILKKGFEKYKDCSFWECIANKGIMFIRISPKPGVEIDIYSSHLNAWEKYSSIRSRQLIQAYDFIRENSKDRPFLFVGDFNGEEGTENYTQIINQMGLRDSYREYVSTLKNPSATVRNGFTFDIETNPWTRREDHSQRLDYIFYQSSDRVQLKVKESALAFTERVKDNKPLSDHYGMTTLFEIY